MGDLQVVVSVGVEVMRDGMRDAPVSVHNIVLHLTN